MIDFQNIQVGNKIREVGSNKVIVVRSVGGCSKSEMIHINGACYDMRFTSFEGA